MSGPPGYPASRPPFTPAPHAPHVPYAPSHASPMMHPHGQSYFTPKKWKVARNNTVVRKTEAGQNCWISFLIIVFIEMYTRKSQILVTRHRNTCMVKQCSTHSIISAFQFVRWSRYKIINISLGNPRASDLQPWIIFQHQVHLFILDGCKPINDIDWSSRQICRMFETIALDIGVPTGL